MWRALRVCAVALGALAWSTYVDQATAMWDGWELQEIAGPTSTEFPNERIAAAVSLGSHELRLRCLTDEAVELAVLIDHRPKHRDFRDINRFQKRKPKLVVTIAGRAPEENHLSTVEYTYDRYGHLRFAYTDIGDMAERVAHHLLRAKKSAKLEIRYLEGPSETFEIPVEKAARPIQHVLKLCKSTKPPSG